MKVIAINGSARKDGNTAVLLNTVLAQLQAAGMETELMHLLFSFYNHIKTNSARIVRSGLEEWIISAEDRRAQ